METLYVITKNSGLKLNQQRTDFNVRDIHFATFRTREEAEKWIIENNHKFIGIESGNPVNLNINKIVIKSPTEYAEQ